MPVFVGLIPNWRDLLYAYRRMEARGERREASCVGDVLYKASPESSSPSPKRWVYSES
jgi:hypothetical protein